PFHADCYVLAIPPTEPSASGIQCSRTPQRGYDRLDFLYDPARRSAYEALSVVLEAAEDELALYYNVYWMDRARVRAWDEVESLVDELVLLHSESGVRAWLGQLRRSSGLTGQALILETQFEIDAMQEDAGLRRSFDEVFARGDHLFDDWVED